MMDLFALRQAFLLGAAFMAVGTVLFGICTISENLNQGKGPLPQPHIPEG